MTTKHGKPEVKFHELSTEHVKVAREIVVSTYRPTIHGPGASVKDLPAEDMRLQHEAVLKTDDGKGVWVPVDVFVSWEAVDLCIAAKPNATKAWSGAPDPADPDNFWIDDATGDRVSASTGERTPKGWDKVETGHDYEDDYEDDYARWQRDVACGMTELSYHDWKKRWSGRKP